MRAKTIHAWYFTTLQTQKGRTSFIEPEENVTRFRQHRRKCEKTLPRGIQTNQHIKKTILMGKIASPNPGFLKIACFLLCHVSPFSRSSTAHTYALFPLPIKNEPTRHWVLPLPQSHHKSPLLGLSTRSCHVLSRVGVCPDGVPGGVWKR